MILLFTVLTYISGVTYYLSATVNPILYQVVRLGNALTTVFRDPSYTPLLFNKIFLFAVSWVMTSLFKVMSLKFRQAFVDTFGCCCPEEARSKANADLTFASFYNHNSAASVHSSSRTHRRRSLSTQNLSLTAATTMSPTQLTAPNNALAPNGSAAPVRKMSSSWTDLRNVGGCIDGEAGVAALSNQSTQQCAPVTKRDTSPPPEVISVAEV